MTPPKREEDVNYKEVANDARKKVLEMIWKAQTSHIGSNFSVIDIATVLYEKANLTKDKIIWSAGWKAATAYYFLAQKGIIKKEDLDTYCREGSKFIGLLEPTVNGVSCAGGSMGYGIGFGIGFALAKKLKKEEGTIFVLMSDGEMQVGTTWESAMIAAHHKLDNLVVICDGNSLQAMGKVEDILSIEPIGLKWAAFGWHQETINGHNFDEIEKAITKKRDLDKPAFIMARTEKGYPISFMRGQNIFHYKHLLDSEFSAALKELENA